MMFVVLLLVTRPGLFLGSANLDRIAIILGALVALAGQGFRLLVIGYVYIKRGGKKRAIYANKLVVEGIYNHTRNPMYVGNFLITVGVGMMYGSPWIYLFVIPFFSFVYLSIVVAEETFLRNKFGEEYEEYAKRVNRFVPDFRGIEKSLKDYQYDWRRAIRKDYGTIFGTLFGIILICLWKTYYFHGYQARRGELLILASFLIPLFSSYALIRYLKVRGDLDS